MTIGLLMSVSVASAGYGDASSGYPSYDERELHLWTNAARVDPEAFESDYQSGGCSYYVDFSEDEQTAKQPLLWNFDLNEAGRFHSDDMLATGNFSHDSSDGTSFSARLARFYPSGMVGENIAVGYGSSFSAVMNGWMCSTDGHRANIMSGGWDELGTGVASSYYTQDFGSRGVEPEYIAMGVHIPMAPTGGVELIADFFDPSEVEPESMVAMLNGVPQDMSLLYGESHRGIYGVDVVLDDTTVTCFEYYFEATVAGEPARFPEEGSYAWGDCGYDDESAGWIRRQLVGETGGTDMTEQQLLDQFELVGCSVGGGAVGAWWVLLGLPLVRRRR